MKSISHLAKSEQRSGLRGFTLTELLVIIALVSMLALTLLPARAGSRTKSQNVRCLDNLRQLMGAMMLYTHDNHDLFPPNPDDNNTIPGHNWCGGDAGVGGFAEFNPDILANPSTCLLATYINTNISLFRCTADSRRGRYQGTDPTKMSLVVPAARTISMSGAVGTICPGFNSGGGHSGKPTLSVNGPWLDGMHGNRRNTPWRTYGKTSEMVIPSPSKLCVIVEESPYSVNDAGFAFSAGQPKWVDYPSTLHNMGCVLAFADGHAELHRWTNPSIRLTAPATGMLSVPPNDPDWLWLAARISARAQ